jgi:hypothetical protein
MRLIAPVAPGPNAKGELHAHRFKLMGIEVMDLEITLHSLLMRRTGEFLRYSLGDGESGTSSQVVSDSESNHRSWVHSLSVLFQPFDGGIYSCEWARKEPGLCGSRYFYDRQLPYCNSFRAGGLCRFRISSKETIGVAPFKLFQARFLNPRFYEDGGPICQHFGDALHDFCCVVARANDCVATQFGRVLQHQIKSFGSRFLA